MLYSCHKEHFSAARVCVGRENLQKLDDIIWSASFIHWRGYGMTFCLAQFKAAQCSVCIRALKLYTRKQIFSVLGYSFKLSNLY